MQIFWRNDIKLKIVNFLFGVFFKQKNKNAPAFIVSLVWAIVVFYNEVYFLFSCFLTTKQKKLNTRESQTVNFFFKIVNC